MTSEGVAYLVGYLLRVLPSCEKYEIDGTWWMWWHIGDMMDPKPDLASWATKMELQSRPPALGKDPYQP